MATNNTSKARAYWDGMNAERKRQAVIGAVIAGFLIVAYPFVSGADTSKEPRKAQGASNKKIEQLLTNANPRDLGISGLASELDEQKKVQSQILTQLTEMRDGAPSGDREARALRDELAKLRGEIDSLRAGTTVAGNGTSAALTPLPGADIPRTQEQPGTLWTMERPDQDAPVPASGPGQYPGPGGRPPNGAAPPSPPRNAFEIRTITASPPPDDAATRDARKKVERVPVYLPSGSIITGVLLNGMDAPTGRSAASDPLPVLVRISKEAILAGRRRMDIRECHALAAGYGDLASERLYLRSERISCIRTDGGVIDVPIAMYAVGEDSKAGLRGTVVSKQGALLSRALLAGFAEGVSKAFAPTNYSVIGGAGFDTRASQGLEAGALGGASSALDRIADHYLKMADAMHPVIEVSGGRKITFITVSGTELDIASR
jgi:conjugal transfer pilus assembly protein TraB